MMEKNRKDCQAMWQDYFAQHGYLEHMAEAAAASFGRAISELLASEQLTMPDGLRMPTCSTRRASAAST